MEFVVKKANTNLPYAMLLTRLYNRVMDDFSHLRSEDYLAYDGVMFPLTQHIERKTMSDLGSSNSSTSTPSTFLKTLTNALPQIPQNLESRDQTVITLLTQIRDEQRKGFKSVAKGIKNFMKRKKDE
ncbi:hypothetical protein CTI12_AA133120 [Artemisia annua]|uniref:Uncharacterized protein n=1 Tax=Artemisia annua TaxID=35608 RepID=A0A2U1NAX2_ARTAN|nr:hypothetical protein CTI12_AA133120 [Artemisia annua]